MFYVDIFGILFFFHILGDFFIKSPWIVRYIDNESDLKKFNFGFHIFIYTSMVISGLFIIKQYVLVVNDSLIFFISVGLYLIITHTIIDLATIRDSNLYKKSNGKKTRSDTLKDLEKIKPNCSRFIPCVPDVGSCFLKNFFFQKQLSNIIIIRPKKPDFEKLTINYSEIREISKFQNWDTRLNLKPFPCENLKVGYQFLQRVSVETVFFNQILLISSIVISTFLISQVYSSISIHNDYGKYALVLSIYLLCLTPSTAFVKRVLLYFIEAIERNSMEKTNYRIKCEKSIQVESILMIGKYFGWVEMVLTLTLTLFHAFDAIGFLIAAKTYINFQSYKDDYREIFVFGTLLSICIALILGTLLLFLINNSSFIGFLKK